MDFVDGVPLNRLANTMKERGIEPGTLRSQLATVVSRSRTNLEPIRCLSGSPESKLAGRRILSQLSEAFSRMMLGAGFIHGDPHPGNIFVQAWADLLNATHFAHALNAVLPSIASVYKFLCPKCAIQSFQEGGRVALIDCGQVKQISTAYRLQLAEAILLVNKWQETGGTPELVKTAQEKVRVASAVMRS